MIKLDIVVPILNEKDNLSILFYRIDKALKNKKIDYRIIVVDDHSTDGSDKLVRSLSKKYPVIFKTKKGKKGKAYSILEGSKYCDSEHILMIDADLQYAPEDIPKLFDQMIKNPNVGVVIGNRVLDPGVGFIRKMVSRASRFINGKLVMGLDMDVQSGMKLFKKEIIKQVDVKDVYPWALDIPLINEACEMGYEVVQIEIPFVKRKKGNAKINLIKATRQILWGAVKVRFKPKKVYQTKMEGLGMINAGFLYKKKKFITHSTLHPYKSAIKTVVSWQKYLIFFSLLGTFLSFIFFGKTAAIVLVAILTFVYFIDVLFNLYLVFKSLHFPPEISFSENDFKSLDDSKLPIYTILSPLYREGGVIEEFVNSIKKIDYPKNKLDVILLLEEDDQDTKNSILDFNLPDYFRVLIVPHSDPKTKPKACNFGLNHAQGEYVVIYDAEDRPDPLQLKKAYLGFSKLGPGYVCLQAKLNYYNPHQNLLTRLFTAEYSLWFDVILPALQSIDTTIPLGGTSNHFRTKQLLKLKGWDPFNVTEDADLGVRLFKNGGKTAIIDSVTLEEANSNLRNWIRQRSRWIKGYMQTFLVHTRNPIVFFRRHKRHFLIFQLISGLRISFMFINPVMWFLTVSYFVLYGFIGAAIESFYPAPIFYMAVTSAVFGNFLYVYYYMIGAAKRGQWAIIKYIFLVPVYWLFTSIAGFIALWQLITRPYYWEKTMHGLVKGKTKRVINRFQITGLRDFGITTSLAKLRKLTQTSFLSGAFLVMASMVANVLNFVYNAYLGRKLSLEDFGLLGLVGSFMYLIQVPLSAISRTVTHRSAYLLGKFKKPVKEFWAITRARVLKISIVLAFIWAISIPFLKDIFNSYETLPFITFLPIWILGFAGSVDRGFLGGNLFFKVEGIASIIEALVKLAAVILIVEIGFHDLVYLAIPISMSASYFISWSFIKKAKGTLLKAGREVVEHFPVKFFYSSAINKLSTVAFLSLDLILVKMFLSGEDAGRYALISLIGKIVYMVGSTFTQFILPIVSKEEGSGIRTEKSFYRLMTITGLSTLSVFVLLGLFGNVTLPILFGSKSFSVISYIPMYSLAMVLQTMVGGVIIYNQAKNKHFFSYFGLLLAGIQALLIILFHRDLSQVIGVMFISSVLNFSTLLTAHFYYGRLENFGKNLLDFLGVFKNIPSLNKYKRPDRLKILVFNWRDTRHIWAGGAEIYVHEIAKRWVEKGHIVTVFCGNDRKSPRNEVIEGVQIVRRGGFYTVYLWAFLYYILRFRSKYDVVIDNENGIPFFTPLYVKEPVVGLIHHVHQEVILKELKLPKYLLPVGVLALLLERYLMPWVYKNCQMITVSESSKNDMEKIGFGKNTAIQIVNPGVTLSLFKPSPKTKHPSILYLGRLKHYKSIDTLVRATKNVLRVIPDLKLNIAGYGESRKSLEKLVKDLKLGNIVSFLGKVTDDQKVKFLGGSWVFAYPSTFEGWGISIIEANACGTPVVASDVAGLRDSVKNYSTGYLVKAKSEKHFANALTAILKNNSLRRRLSKNSIQWANNFDWNQSSVKFMTLLYDYLYKLNSNKAVKGELEISLD